MQAWHDGSSHINQSVTSMPNTHPPTFDNPTADVSPKPILIVQQKTAIFARRIDSHIISGNFAGIEWRNLRAISDGIVETIASANIISEEEIDAIETLHLDAASQTISPSIHLYSRVALDSDKAGAIKKLCRALSARILKSSCHRSETDDLYDDAPEKITLTETEELAVKQGSTRTSATIGAKITHPVAILDEQTQQISALAGKTRKHTRAVVGTDRDIYVNAVIDELSYSKFTLRLICENGDVVDGYYGNRELFSEFANELKSQKAHHFLVKETLTDDGKTIRSVSFDGEVRP